MKVEKHTDIKTVGDTDIEDSTTVYNLHLQVSWYYMDH